MTPDLRAPTYGLECFKAPLAKASSKVGIVVTRMNPNRTANRILRIVLVSPSDVLIQRSVVRNVVNDVNNNCGRFFGLRLELRGWEDTLPGLDTKGPQGRIDGDLDIADSDFVVGIFWRRLGTPLEGTGETGSEHEIRTAYNSWSSSGRPQIMLYFDRQGVDNPEAEDLEQMLQVRKFAEEFQRKALVTEYLGPEDFAIRIRNHLTNIVSRAAAEQVQPASIPCAVTAMPKVMRGEGIAEFIGEVRLSLPKRPDLNSIPIEVEVGLNTNITNQITDTNEATEAVLIVEREQNDHHDSELVHGTLTSANMLRFPPVRLQAGGTQGVHTIRLLGIRANALLLGFGAEVWMFVRIKTTAGPGVSVLNPQVTVGFCHPSLVYRFQTAVLSPTQGANSQFALGETSRLQANFEWTFNEGFPGAFKNQAQENIAGTYTGPLPDISTAKRGTLIGVAFQGLPYGVRLFALISDTAASSARVRLVRDATTDNVEVMSDKGPMAPIRILGSTALAIWEWVNAGPPTATFIAQTVTVAFAVVVEPGKARPDITAASANFCPLGTVPTASRSAPVPRFGQPYAPMNVLSFYGDAPK